MVIIFITLISTPVELMVIIGKLNRYFVILKVINILIVDFVYHSWISQLHSSKNQWTINMPFFSSFPKRGDEKNLLLTLWMYRMWSLKYCLCKLNIDSWRLCYKFNCWVSHQVNWAETCYGSWSWMIYIMTLSYLPPNT